VHVSDAPVRGVVGALPQLRIEARWVRGGARKQRVKRAAGALCSIQW
jgi:hypothetical protein